MLLGYARVSKADDQDSAAQVRGLKAAGCTRVYEETASGGRWDRPELHRLLDHLRDGDALSSASWRGLPKPPRVSLLSTARPCVAPSTRPAANRRCITAWSCD